MGSTTMSLRHIIVSELEEHLVTMNEAGPVSQVRGLR